MVIRTQLTKTQAELIAWVFADFLASAAGFADYRDELRTHARNIVRWSAALPLPSDNRLLDVEVPIVHAHLITLALTLLMARQAHRSTEAEAVIAQLGRGESLLPAAEPVPAHPDVVTLSDQRVTRS